MNVSLVIPIYNEADHLERFLDLIDDIDLPIPKELVFVDDKSTDGSFEILSRFKFKSPVVIFQQPVNQGKGAAVRKGFQLATGRIIGVQDADFEYSPDDLPALLQPLIDGKSDVVFGSRFKKSTLQVHRTFHYLINRFLTIASNFMSGLYLTDMETCYKFFRAEIIKNIVLESNRFGFEPEVTAKIAKLKVRVMEVPISYYPRNYLEGKKITWRDGIAALWHIFAFNYLKSKTPFSPDMPKQFVAQSKLWL